MRTTLVQATRIVPVYVHLRSYGRPRFSVRTVDGVQNLCKTLITDPGARAVTAIKFTRRHRSGGLQVAQVIQRMGAATVLLPTATARASNNTNRRRSTAPTAPRFAHPAELFLANWLTSQHVRWEYEPTTFPLRQDFDGRLLQSFTPDFYLPDFDLYVEMTTMRQALVTRKNQKFRRMRELYPHLNITLLYRKDVELITSRYGKAADSSTEASQELMSPEELERSLSTCVEALLESPTGSPIVLVPTCSGDGFASILATRLAEIGQVATIMSAPDAIALVDPVDHVVVVAGAIGTGVTLWNECSELVERGSQVIALVNRPGARLAPFDIRCAVATVGATWILGCGLGDNHSLALQSISGDSQLVVS